MGGSAITREARPTAGPSRYIGRVGGLAFALGIGAAVLAGPGLASAETSESGTSETSSAHRSGRSVATTFTVGGNYSGALFKDAITTN